MFFNLNAYLKTAQINIANAKSVSLALE